MSDQNGNGEWRGWKTEVAQAIVRQGPVGIILLFAMYAAWQWGDWLLKTGVPAHLSQIQSGYTAIQESHDRNIASMIKANNDSVTKMINSIDMATEEMKRSNQRLESAITELIKHEHEDDAVQSKMLESIMKK